MTAGDPGPTILSDARDRRGPERQRRDPRGAVGPEHPADPELARHRERRRVDATVRRIRQRWDEDHDVRARRRRPPGCRSGTAPTGSSPCRSGRTGRRSGSERTARRGRTPAGPRAASPGVVAAELGLVEAPAVGDRLADPAEQTRVERGVGRLDLGLGDGQPIGGQADAVEPRRSRRGRPRRLGVRTSLEDRLDRGHQVRIEDRRGRSREDALRARRRRAPSSGGRRGPAWLRERTRRRRGPA